MRLTWLGTTHKNATTGVHGVGSDYIAKSSVAGLDLASHADRHKWLGEDEIEVRFLVARLPIVFFDFTTMDAWTLAVTGTGSGSWDGPQWYTLKTGTTVNSQAYLYTGRIGMGYPEKDGQYWGWYVSPRVTSDATVYLWALYSAASLPGTLTAKHAGFKIINKRIWATNADGSTEKATDTGVDWADLGYAQLEMVGTGTGIKYYINGVLKATHTENLPATYNHRNYCYIENTAAADKSVALLNLTFLKH